MPVATKGARDGQGVGLDNQRGTVTICSCSPIEFSYEIDGLGHGAFTHGLIEGLRLHGGAELRNRRAAGCLSSDARAGNMPAARASRGRRRALFAKPLSKRHFILLPDIALPEDLEPLELEALEAEANDDLALAEEALVADQRGRAYGRAIESCRQAYRTEIRTSGAQPKKPKPPAPNPPTPPLPPDDQTVKTSRRRLVIGAAAWLPRLLVGGGLLVLASTDEATISRASARDAAD